MGHRWRRRTLVPSDPTTLPGPRRLGKWDKSLPNSSLSVDFHLRLLGPYVIRDLFTGAYLYVYDT